MIEFITGIIEDKKEEFCVINHQGLGYRVYMPGRILHALKLQSEEKICIYHHFREDSQELYGFLSANDRDVFQLLISVSGVGPKVALKALGQFDANTLLNAISIEDLDTLTQISGIGKKGAERIVIELKDKCGSLGFESKTNSQAHYVPNTLDQDITAALKQLGYDNQEVRQALSNSHKDRENCSTVEENLKVLLKFL
jgi:Holliday junction DNA helicase RuvA